MAANIGTQTITLLYYTIANSGDVNKRHVDIRQKGIYKGGWLTVVNSSHAGISPLVCEIADSNYQVRAKTADTVNLSVTSGTPYIVLRWAYTGSITDYMQLLAVATPAANDLVVGKCTFTGGSTLNGFLYTERSGPNTHDLFLKVEETGDSDLRVRIRAGRIQTPSGDISIADQKSDLFVPPASPNSKVYLVYINTSTGAISIDNSGTPAVTPVSPDYAGKLVIAEVTLAYNASSIPQSKIKDVRSFSSNSVDVDGITIQKLVTGKLASYRLENRTNDPSGGELTEGRIWLRTDL